MLTVAAVNHSSHISGEELQKVCRALSIHATHHVAPAWGVVGMSVQPLARRDQEWQLAFLENSDQANALGYHDDQVNGLPLMKVFVQDCRDAGVSWSACASHELDEAMLDPDLIRVTIDSQNNRIWALEVGDPAQSSTYILDGVELQDFVTPAWFNPEPPEGAKFDHTGQIKAPFEVPSGGYAQFLDLSQPSKGWQDIGFELGANPMVQAGHSRPQRRSVTVTS